MKPTIEQIAYIRRDAERVLQNGHDLSWSEAADMARFVLDTTTDPTPMPAPALGMRVWFEHTHPSGGTVTHSEDMRDASPGEWWGENVNKIVIITDFRTGEVIWRRS